MADLPILLRPWDGPLGAPPFAQVRPEDFPSAFDTAMAWHRAEIAAIADQSAAPDFDNTIAALERSGFSPVAMKVWADSPAPVVVAVGPNGAE